MVSQDISSNNTMQSDRAPSGVFSWSAVLLVTVAGVAVLTILPLLVGALEDSGNLSKFQVSWIVVADTAGIMIAAATAPFWVHKVSWRPIVSLALMVFILANYLTLWTLDQFEILFIIRMLAGLGAGVAYSIALASTGAYGNSEKAFGYVVGIQVVYGVFSFMYLPSIVAEGGVRIIIQYLFFWLIPAFLCAAFFFPKGHKSADTEDFLSLLPIWKPVLMVFAGLSIFYIAAGGVWAYMERIGNNAQITASQVGDILMIGYAVSFLGALGCEKVAAYFNRSVCLGIAGFMMIVTLSSLLFLGGEKTYWIYAIGTIVYQFFWSFALPAVMGVFNGVDPSGRTITLSATAFKVGEFIGPPLMASMMVAGDYSPVIWTGIICITIGLSILVLANRLYVRGNV